MRSYGAADKLCQFGQSFQCAVFSFQPGMRRALLPEDGTQWWSSTASRMLSRRGFVGRCVAVVRRRAVFAQKRLQAVDQLIELLNDRVVSGLELVQH